MKSHVERRDWGQRDVLTECGKLAGWWPLVLGMALYTGILVAQVWRGTRANGGIFCYALDDAYIHMAIARSLALHGIWGLNPEAGFASASSSPGWTLLLAAAVKIFGDRVWLSLALNAVFALLLLWFADRALRRWDSGAAPWIRVALQAGLVLLVPLPDLALVGMEHSAQAFAVVLVGAFAVDAMVKLQVAWGSVEVRLLLAVFFAAAIRYETVFLVLPVAIGLLWRRRAALAFAFAASAALPPLLFGVYARSHGPFWLPYSVMSKAGGSYIASAVKAWTSYALVGSNITLSCLLIGAIALLVALGGGDRPSTLRPRLLLGLFAAVDILHVTLAPIGWLMRYEGYLVALGWLALAAGLAVLWPRWADAAQRPESRWLAVGAGVMAMGLVYPVLMDRAWTGISKPTQAMHDRYFEHLQPALFVAKNFDHATIVANDIGAMSYYSDARLLDPVGLGSAEPLLARRKHGQFTADDLNAWAGSKGAKIAVLETGWTAIHAVVPTEWVRVETWHFPRNVVYDNLEVSFFAVDPAEAPELRRKLAAFVLPQGMTRNE